MKHLKIIVPWVLCGLLVTLLLAVPWAGESVSQIERMEYRISPFHTEMTQPLDARSFIERQGLPALSRMDAAEQAQYIEPLQVMRKLSRLGLSDQDLLYPEILEARLYEEILQQEATEKTSVVFSGETTAELNAFLLENAGKKVGVSSEKLLVNQTIRVPDHTILTGAPTWLESAGVNQAFYQEGGCDIEISGFVIEGGFEYGIYLADIERAVIRENRLKALSKKPLVLMGECTGIVVADNEVEGNQHGGIYLNGDISNSLIEGNRITGNFGTSNWMAGIVLTAIRISDKSDPYAGFRTDLHFPEEERLDEMLSAPHRVIVRNNTVSGNNSSGIYCDGAYLVYITENQITGNDKEGLCLDYGTIGAYIACNDIRSNGNRARQTDQDLKNDFVLDAGRLEDGSSCSKLPGISIDNSACNIIYDNRVEGNYGSGVKMVRTGVRNIISTNIIHDNNRGAGDTFHFFGIELGFAAADVEAVNLDFVSDYENIICRNLITGAHYAGIFLAEETYINDFFDNVILDASCWSMESLSQRYNSTVNNLSQLPSRGISLSAASGPAIVLPQIVN